MADSTTPATTEQKDTVVYSVVVDNKTALIKIDSTAKEINKLNAANAALDKSSEAYARASARAKALTAELKALFNALKNVATAQKAVGKITIPVVAQQGATTARKAAGVATPQAATESPAAGAQGADVKIDSEDAAKAKALRVEIEALIEANKQLEKSSDAYLQNRVKVKLLSDEERTLTRSIVNREKASKAGTGSLADLRAQLSILTAEYVGLSKEERETSQRGIELRNTIRGLSDEIKSIEKGIGDNRRNVGNYAEGFKEASVSVKNFGGNVRGMGQSLGLANPALGEFANIITESIGLVTGLGGAAKGLITIFQGWAGASSAAAEATTAAAGATVLAGDAAAVAGVEIAAAGTAATAAGSSMAAAGAAGAGGFSLAAASVKVFKTALVSSGIGALVLAVASLATYFTSTLGGAQKLERILGQVGAVVDVVIDRFSSFGEALIAAFESPGDVLDALIDNIIARVQALGGVFTALRKAASGDFKALADNFVQLTTGSRAGIDGLKKQVNSFLGDAQRAASAMDKLIQRQQALRASERELSVERAKTNLINRDLYLTSQIETNTTKERRDALIQAIENEKKLNALETANAKEALAILKAKISLSKITEEDQENLAKAEAKVAEVQLQGLRDYEDFTEALSRFDLEVRQRNLASQRATIDAQLLNVQVGSKKELELKKQAAKNDRDQTLLDINLTNEQKKLAEVKYQNDIKQLDAAFTAQRYAAELEAVNARIQAAEGGTQELLDLEIARLKLERDTELTNTQLTLTEKATIEREYQYKVSALRKAFDAQALNDYIAGQKLELDERRRIGAETLQLQMQIADAERQAALSADKLTAQQRENIEREYQARIAEIQKEAEQRADESRAGFLSAEIIRRQTAGQNVTNLLIQQEIERRDALLKQTEITEGQRAEIIAQSEAKVKELRQQGLQDSVSTAQNAIGFISQTASQVSSLLSSFDEQTKQRRIKAAGDNQAEIESIEKEYAEKEKQRQIVLATINTAQAAIAAYAGAAAIPGLGPIAAALATAFGLAQIALISNQQFATGGYTGRGLYKSDSTGHNIAGVVHANEFVVTAQALQKPEIASMVASINQFQTKGFATGGFTTSPVAPSLQTFVTSQDLINIVSALPRPEVKVTQINNAQKTNADVRVRAGR